MLVLLLMFHTYIWKKCTHIRSIPVSLSEEKQNRLTSILFFLAFCHILMDIRNKRLRKYYDEECCTTQIQSDVDDDKTRNEKKRLKRRRKARYRWFLAYTFIHNYHLYDLSKRYRDQLIRMFLQRSTSSNGQPFTPLETSQGTANNTIFGASKAPKMQRIP